VNGTVHAPGGINTHLRSYIEKKLAAGVLYQPSPTSSNNSDASESAPHKRNPKKPAIARKKPAIKKPTVNRKKTAKPKRKSTPKAEYVPDPAAAAAYANPPPDATEAEISYAVSAWFHHHNARVTDGVVQCLNPGHTVPQCAQTWMGCARAQIESMKTRAASRNTESAQQRLPVKRISPTADREAENEHPSGSTENAPTVPEAMDANPSATAENAPIEIDAQGGTVEDPIIINESTSNSNSDSAKKADNNPKNT